MPDVQSPKDDFFAPRPKLPRGLRLVRGFSLAVGVLIGLCSVLIFSWLYGLLIVQYRSRLTWEDILFMAFVVGAVQLILLIPIWRSYCLRGWGAGTTLVIAAILAAAFPNFILLTMPICLWGFLLLFIEWPNLKSGF